MGGKLCGIALIIILITVPLPFLSPVTLPVAAVIGFVGIILNLIGF